MTEQAAFQTTEGSDRLCQTKPEHQKSSGTKGAHCVLSRSL